MLRCECASLAVPLPAVAGTSAPLASAIFLSLGLKPSPVLAGVFEGVTVGLGSQIAVTMARDGVITEGPAAAASFAGTETEALEIVRSVFREANTRVYEYGHRMAAGGQVSAKGIVAVFDGERMSIGQAGECQSFLWRGGKLMPFFAESGTKERPSGGVLERFVGANAKILVDLATVKVRDGDVLVVTTLAPHPDTARLVEGALQETSSLREACAELVRRGRDVYGYEELQQRPGAFKTLAVFMWEVGEG